MFNLNTPSSSAGDWQIDGPPGWWNWMLGLLEVAEARGKGVEVGYCAVV